MPVHCWRNRYGLCPWGTHEVRTDRGVPAPSAPRVPGRADAGLDVSVQRRLREFIAQRNAEGVTVLLTSHYTADVQALCRRVVLISSGSLFFDGTLDALSAGRPVQAIDGHYAEAADSVAAHPGDAGPASDRTGTHPPRGPGFGRSCYRYAHRTVEPDRPESRGPADRRRARPRVRTE